MVLSDTLGTSSVPPDAMEEEDTAELEDQSAHSRYSRRGSLPAQSPGWGWRGLVGGDEPSTLLGTYLLLYISLLMAAWPLRGLLWKYLVLSSYFSSTA